MKYTTCTYITAQDLESPVRTVLAQRIFVNVLTELQANILSMVYSEGPFSAGLFSLSKIL